MKITRVQAPPPPQPPAQYVLTLDYTELHELYHLMLDMDRAGKLYPGGIAQGFFVALKAHA